MSIYIEQFDDKLDLPVYLGDTKIYMIASTPRCGSHLLGHLLTEGRKYGVPLEYLNGGNLPYWKKKFNTKDIKETLVEVKKNRTTPNGVFGFKAHWMQYRRYIKSGIYKDILNCESIIWIYRADILKQAISLSIAHQTGQWISSIPSEESKSLSYSYENIRDLANKIHKWNNAWRDYLSSQKTHKCRALKVCYEDLIENINLVQIIASFISGDESNISLKEKTKKQASTINKEWEERFLNELKPADKWIAEKIYW